MNEIPKIITFFAILKQNRSPLFEREKGGGTLFLNQKATVIVLVFVVFSRISCVYSRICVEILSLEVFPLLGEEKGGDFFNIYACSTIYPHNVPRIFIYTAQSRSITYGPNDRWINILCHV